MADTQTILELHRIASVDLHALWTQFTSTTSQEIECANYSQKPEVITTGPNYIDAGGSGAYYLINGSQTNQLAWDLGTPVPIQVVPQSSNWPFAGWNFGSDQNPADYYAGGIVEPSANLKELQHSMDASAYSDNSQRKMVQTPNGYLFEAYTDDSHVWVEYSSNQGSSWTLANNGEPLDYNPVNGSDPGNKCPSLDYDPSSNDVTVVFQKPYGSTYQIDYAVFVPSGSTYIQDADGPIYTEGSDSYSVNANPDFAMYNGFWLIAFEKKSASGSQKAGIKLSLRHFQRPASVERDRVFHVGHRCEFYKTFDLRGKDPVGRICGRGLAGGKRQFIDNKICRACLKHPDDGHTWPVDSHNNFQQRLARELSAISRTGTQQHRMGMLDSKQLRQTAHEYHSLLHGAGSLEL